MSQTNSIRQNEMNYPTGSEEFNSDELGWMGMEDDLDTGEVEGDGFTSSPADLKSHLSDLQAMLNSSKLSPTERRQVLRQIFALSGKVSRTQGMNPRQAEMELSVLETEMAKLEAKITGQADPTAPSGEDALGNEEGTIDLKQLKKDLNKEIDDIDGRDNLTTDEKIDLKTPLEKLLTKIEIAKDDSSKIDPEEIHEAIVEAQEAVESQDAYSPALKGLAGATDMEPEKIKAKAAAKGIDLDALTLPPSMEVLNFLSEMVPDIKDAFKKVETAVSDRIKSIQDNQKIMGDIANANCNKDTSDNCNTEVGPWQNLYNLKHFQDGESKKVASAMQDLVKTLIPIFKELFPGQEVKAVEDNSPGGWQKAQGEYLVADKIQIGNKTIDLINNTTGKMQSSDQPDTDINITFNDLWGDSEGKGEWDPPALQTYGDPQPTKMDNENKEAW